MAKQGVEYLRSLDKERHDRVAALAAAGVLLAPSVLVAAGVMIESRSLNPFIKQERGGVMLRKFRTLRREAEQGELKTFGTFDPRATAIGKLIRPIGIDESPQVLSVLEGTMSFCGIREILETDKEKWYEADHCLYDELEAAKAEAGVKPALVGRSSLWRKGVINGLPSIVARKSMRMDMDYVENATLRSDTLLIAQVPPALISSFLHKQTYEIDIAAINPREDFAA